MYFAAVQAAELRERLKYYEDKEEAAGVGCVSGENDMTFEKVVEILREEYERAVELDYVMKPLAYALYQTWYKVDRKKTSRLRQKTDE